MPSKSTLQRQCDKWNARYPVGTSVKAYRLRNPPRELRGIFKTVLPAEVIGGHTAVVWIDGLTGCEALALDAIEPVDERERT